MPWLSPELLVYYIVLYFNCIALYVHKSRNSPLQCEAHIQNLNWQGRAMYFCTCNCNYTCIYTLLLPFYIFELPPFVVFLIKLYLVSNCFSHF